MVAENVLTGFAVAVIREEGQWSCNPMREAVLTGVDTALTELRMLRSSGAVFGLLAVEEEFFVIIRPRPDGAAFMLSDAAAALDYDIAADVLEWIDVVPPEDDDDAIWPEGELGILSDLGLSAAELDVITNEVDLYPDEQLQIVAQRCGFGDEFSSLLDEL